MDSSAQNAASAEMAHETIDLMTQYGVLTTAPNYEVWLTHRLGANPALSREIEGHIVRGEAFSEALNDELFEKFFSHTRLSQQMMETGECIARELAQVLEALKSGGDMSSSYADKLQEAASSFENSLDAAHLRQVVSGLAAATRDMVRRSNDLNHQMQNSALQVATLQTNLQSAEAEARQDGLTGLANRRTFDVVLRRQTALAQQAHGMLTLIMCDIDHFKTFNDRWGHPVGDQVLRFIAQTLKERVPGAALAARYGGEEFGIVLPNVSLQDAHAIGEAVRIAVRSKKLVRRSTQEQIGVVTISMGIAAYLQGEKPSALLARADSCLYAAKRAGRDQIVLDTDAIGVAA